MKKFDKLYSKIINEELGGGQVERGLEGKYAHLNAEEAKKELLKLLQVMRLKDTGVPFNVVEVLGDKILGGKARELDMSMDEILDAIGEELDISLDYIEGSNNELVTYSGL
jgi:hypothetical protein